MPLPALTFQQKVFIEINCISCGQTEFEMYLKTFCRCTKSRKITINSPITKLKTLGNVAGDGEGGEGGRPTSVCVQKVFNLSLKKSRYIIRTITVSVATI